MLRKVRIIIIILFIAVLVVFLATGASERRSADYVAPVITAESDRIEASVTVTDEELLQGMKAVDNKDGDVTSTLVVASRSKFISKNTVKVRYAAFDNNNNVGTFTRELYYTDYKPPRFSLNWPLCFIESDTRDVRQILNNITATDCIDGDITSQIMVTLGDLKTIAQGVKAQPMNLQVSNRSGDTAVLDLEVRFEEYNIFNQLKPHLSTYLLYSKVGDIAPNFLLYADGVGYGNNVTSFADTDFNRYPDVQVDTSKVDYKTPGIYEVTYTLTRLVENGTRQPLGSTVMIVIVEE